VGRDDARRPRGGGGRRVAIRIGFRLLVDENVTPGTAVELRSRGHDAVHVTTADVGLGDGTPGRELVRFASEEDRIVVTGEKGFLDPDHRNGVTALFCLDDDLRPGEVGRLADRLRPSVASRNDLG